MKYIVAERGKWQCGMTMFKCMDVNAESRELVTLVISLGGNP